MMMPQSLVDVVQCAYIASVSARAPSYYAIGVLLPSGERAPGAPRHHEDGMRLCEVGRVGQNLEDWSMAGPCDGDPPSPHARAPRPDFRLCAPIFTRADLERTGVPPAWFAQQQRRAAMDRAMFLWTCVSGRTI